MAKRLLTTMLLENPRTTTTLVAKLHTAKNLKQDERCIIKVRCMRLVTRLLSDDEYKRSYFSFVETSDKETCLCDENQSPRFTTFHCGRGQEATVQTEQVKEIIMRISLMLPFNSADLPGMNSHETGCGKRLPLLHYQRDREIVAEEPE